MKKESFSWKKLFFCLLFPHISILILLLPTAAVLLAVSFIRFESDDVISIASYFISAYTLALWCCRIPKIISFFKNVKHKNKIINRYTTDRHLRIKLSLYFSLIWNTAYGIFQLGLGLWHRSVWFYALAGYYICLALMRFFLASHTRKYNARENLEHEYRKARFCGAVLLVMNIALSAIVVYITLQKRTFLHHEITTIAMAAYTFTTLALAIVGLVRYNKHNSPVFALVKVISFAAALVSMLTLEATMLNVFGAESDVAFNSLMTGLTGAGILGVISLTAILIIRKANKELRKIGEEQNG